MHLGQVRRKGGRVSDGLQVEGTRVGKRKSGLAKRETSKAVEVTGALTKEDKRLMVPGGCRAYMRKTLVREFPAIVQGFVEAAKTGSCPHVKLVTELMRPVRQSSPREKKGPVARYMEERLRERQAEERARLAKGSEREPGDEFSASGGEVGLASGSGGVVERGANAG